MSTLPPAGPDPLAARPGAPYGLPDDVGAGDGLGAGGSPGDDALAGWRGRIDAIDREITGLLNERAACAAEIGRIKRALRLPVYAPRREADVLRNVSEANGGPLPPDAVRRLFERVIDETRTLERTLTEGPPAEDAPAKGPTANEAPADGE